MCLCRCVGCGHLPHHTQRNHLDYAISDVQAEHRVALIGTAVKQRGQSFVIGAAAGASRRMLFTPLISMNKAKATIRKLMIELTNNP